MNKKVEFTKNYIDTTTELAIKELETMVNDEHTNSVTYYSSKLNHFDLPTVKTMAEEFYDSIYGLEISIIFCNNDNIDKDYLVIEVYEKLNEGE